MKGLIILDFNRTLYDPDSQKLFDGVTDFLKSYCGKYVLALIGKGDEKRASLISDLGIEHYFSYIKLKEEKEEADFIECMNSLKSSNELAWSIGDRIKKEIFLSNKARIKTIWFKNGKFASEVPDKKEEEPNFIITSFKEINNIIPL